jgi:hypothetical protein
LLERSTVLKFYEPRTSVLLNDGANGFRLQALPVAAQVSPVYGIAVTDVNGDGTQDIVLGGNLFAVKPEAGRYDALHGLVLTGDGKGGFTALSSVASGLNIPGEVRHVRVLNVRGKKLLVFARNNDTLQFYTLR